MASSIFLLNNVGIFTILSSLILALYSKRPWRLLMRVDWTSPWSVSVKSPNTILYVIPNSCPITFQFISKSNNSNACWSSPSSGHSACMPMLLLCLPHRWKWEKHLGNSFSLQGTKTINKISQNQGLSFLLDTIIK